MITQNDVNDVFNKKKMGKVQRAILEKYGYDPDKMSYRQIFFTFDDLRKEHAKPTS